MFITKIFGDLCHENLKYTVFLCIFTILLNAGIGAISGLRQLLGTENPLNMIKMVLFNLKNSRYSKTQDIRSQDIQTFVLISWFCKTARLEKKG